MTGRRAGILVDGVQRAIVLTRGQRVMLDADLAALYGVPTKALVQAVGRNRSRFPTDFMFRLTRPETTRLRSQFVTSNQPRGRGGRRSAPYGCPLRDPSAGKRRDPAPVRADSAGGVGCAPGRYDSVSGASLASLEFGTPADGRVAR